MGLEAVKHHIVRAVAADVGGRDSSVELCVGPRAKEGVCTQHKKLAVRFELVAVAENLVELKPVNPQKLHSSLTSKERMRESWRTKPDSQYAHVHGHTRGQG